MLRHIVRNRSRCLNCVQTHLRWLAVSSINRENRLKRNLQDGPDLDFFLKPFQTPPEDNPLSSDSKLKVSEIVSNESSKTIYTAHKVYLETYGCQMNVNDSQIVLSILKDHGYYMTNEISEADLILLNTCAIREKPENKIWTRLKQIRRLQQSSLIGVLGCMAERLKTKLLDVEKLADLVVGPDAYRDLPNLLQKLQDPLEDREGAVNVALSLEETYSDILPVRRNGDVTAFLSIMRGCNNMCAFCIVPFTRGRERSRPFESILDEVKHLRDQGVKEITLLGQNVNSYSDPNGPSISTERSKDPFAVYAPGFSSVYKPKRAGTNFAELLDAVAEIDPEIRIRFTSPHPKDFSTDVVRSRANICKQLHVPAQSGNSEVLKRMRRGYDREAYDALIERIRSAIPNVALSTDMIVGFCGETEKEHLDTLDLMECVGFDQAFLFKYSEREKTFAHRHFVDDVLPEIKQRRLEEVIEVFRRHLFFKNQQEIGKTHLVLVEETAKKEKDCLTGRTDTFKRVVFPKIEVQNRQNGDTSREMPKIGDYVEVRIDSVTHGTLRATPLATTKLKRFQMRL